MINLDRLKIKIMKDHPFFGALLHNVTFVESNDVSTAGIDKDFQIAINPDYWDKLTEGQQITAACHEIFHGALMHHSRIFRYHTSEEQRIANYAADYLVNAMLNDAGMELHPSWLLDSKYTPDVYTMESLVEELKKHAKSPPQNQCRMDEDVKNKGKSRSAADEKAKELEMKLSILGAAMQAKKRGNLPGMLDRFITELAKPKQNWKEELREWFNVKMKNDTSWNRPNRRFVSRGIYLPTKYSEGCGHIGVAIDMSGSISNKELSVFESELNHIFELCKPTKVTVVYFDTRLAGPYVFEEFPIKLKACLGGGTNFSVAFNFFNTKCSDITGLVFMTDMYGDWPEEPRYPVCVLSTTPKLTAPYGKTIFGDLKNEG